MIFENGLEEYIKEAPNATGGYEMPDVFTCGCRGNIAFMKILSDAIKGKEINTAKEFMQEVEKAFVRLTGVEFSLDRNIEKEAPANYSVGRAFSKEIYDSDPDEEGMSWGYITLGNWIGKDPVTIEFICEKYNLK